MSRKHVVLWLLIGWAIAWVIPPQRLVAYFKGKSS